MVPLADRIEAQTADLATRSINAMYACDPFWQSRFGARGHRYAVEDGARHVQYLVAALREGSARPLVEYARWTQRVLTTRGMCTQHLAANFKRLAACLEDLGLDEGAHARDYLDQAAAALVYEAGPERALQLITEEVTQHAAARVAVAGEAPGAALSTMVVTLYGFLVDAVALRSDESLGRHLQWLSGTPQEPHLGSVPAFELLSALVDAVAVRAPSLASAVSPLADRVLRALQRPTEVPSS